MHRAVFGVAVAHRPMVRDWVSEPDVPCVTSRNLYSPTVYGWAVLDAGITEIHQYGLTSLPSGVRVVGWQALRLLIDELGLQGPKQALPGETTVPIDELRRRHRSAAARDAAARQRAELLASCADGTKMREVAGLLVDEPGSVDGPHAHPGSSAPSAGKGRMAGVPAGPWLSDRWVERQLYLRAEGRSPDDVDGPVVVEVSDDANEDRWADAFWRAECAAREAALAAGADADELTIRRDHRGSVEVAIPDGRVFRARIVATSAMHRVALPRLVDPEKG